MTRITGIVESERLSLPDKAKKLTDQVAKRRMSGSVADLRADHYQKIQHPNANNN
jgi:hypothetical protein